MIWRDAYDVDGDAFRECAHVGPAIPMSRMRKSGPRQTTQPRRVRSLLSPCAWMDRLQ
jgi:hypothetical protein